MIDFKILKTLVFVSICISQSWAIIAADLANMSNFDKKEITQLKERYGIGRSKDALFTEEQFAFIKGNSLSAIIKTLLLHSVIRFNDIDTVLDLAAEISKSPFSFYELEERMVRYIKKGELPFIALERAIKKTRFHMWRIEQNRRIILENDSFIKSIRSLALNTGASEKLINAYAVCIRVFFDDDARKEFMTPKICHPIDRYKRPTHEDKRVMTRMSSNKDSNLSYAYGQLIAKAASTAQLLHLDPFEKVMMAKCIAEQSLRFFEPLKKPLRALSKLSSMSKKSPSEVFFMTFGLCGNFSTIALNVANELGLKGNIFLSRKRSHIYIEFKDGDRWYHSHPFNSKSKCDIIRF